MAKGFLAGAAFGLVAAVSAAGALSVVVGFPDTMREDVSDAPESPAAGEGRSDEVETVTAEPQGAGAETAAADSADSASDTAEIENTETQAEPGTAAEEVDPARGTDAIDAPAEAPEMDTADAAAPADTPPQPPAADAEAAPVARRDAPSAPVEAPDAAAEAGDGPTPDPAPEAVASAETGSEDSAPVAEPPPAESGAGDTAESGEEIASLPEARNAPAPELDAEPEAAEASEPGTTESAEPGATESAEPEAPESAGGEADESPEPETIESTPPEAADPAEPEVTTPAEPESINPTEEVADTPEEEGTTGTGLAEGPDTGRLGAPMGSLVGRDDPARSERMPRVGEAAAPEADAAEADTDMPPVEAYAVPVEADPETPRMAIVLIDDGAGPLGPDALENFPFPLTFAVDPDLPDAAARVRGYRDRGFEVMALAELPGGAQASDVEIALEGALSAVPEAVGVLEAPGLSLQGSREVSTQATEYLAASGHGLVMQSNGLNTAQSLAAREGVPSAAIFRDFDGEGQDPRVQRRFLDQAAFRARQEDGVVMLGRLRADTISALLLWGLQDRASQVALVPVSAVLDSSDAP